MSRGSVALVVVEAEASIPETSDRDDLNAVGVRVGHIRAREDEQKVGFAKRNLPLGFVVFQDEIAKLYQMRGPLLDLASAELDFDERVTAVLEMEDDVRLQAVAVAVVGDGAAERGGIRAQVPDREVFEEKTERLQVGGEGGRRKAESRRGDGGVCKLALLSGADGGGRPDGRAPRIGVLDLEELPESVEIRIEGGREKALHRGEDVLADAGRIGERGEVAGVGAKDGSREGRIALDAVHRPLFCR